MRFIQGVLGELRFVYAWMREFVLQEDKAWHMTLSFAACFAIGLVMTFGGVQHPLVAAWCATMIGGVVKEFWDAAKPLPPGARRNTLNEHLADTLADAIGATGGLIPLSLVIAAAF